MHSKVKAIASDQNPDYLTNLSRDIYLSPASMKNPTLPRCKSCPSCTRLVADSASNNVTNTVDSSSSLSEQSSIVTPLQIKCEKIKSFFFRKLIILSVQTNTVARIFSQGFDGARLATYTLHVSFAMIFCGLYCTDELYFHEFMFMPSADTCHTNSPLPKPFFN